MPSDNGVTKSRSGGMSVSLSGPDGRVLGGGLSGMLVAAGSVQVRFQQPYCIISSATRTSNQFINHVYTNAHLKICEVITGVLAYRIIFWVDQVVVGSFLHGHQLEQKPKKPRFEHTSSIHNLVSSNPVSDEKSEGAYSGQSPNPTSSPSFHGDNLHSANSMHVSRMSAIGNNNISLSREELQAPSPSKCEVSYWFRCHCIIDCLSVPFTRNFRLTFLWPTLHLVITSSLVGLL